ncbi:hypothetical protein GCM10009744_07440 [Kribbella alba]|uniref:Uncharacterized protein n=1 Tax=Kribbella alba TaxID=190197 RepID=A0ABP4QVF3_9ACTN
MTERIDFGSNTPWGGVNQTELQLIAQQASVGPGYIRIWLLAMSKANRIGHAEFRPGALRDFLGSVNTATGEFFPADKAVVSRTIKRAKDAGLLAPESQARCLVLSSRLFQKAGIGSVSCRTHGIAS